MKEKGSSLKNLRRLNKQIHSPKKGKEKKTRKLINKEQQYMKYTFLSDTKHSETTGKIIRDMNNRFLDNDCKDSF